MLILECGKFVRSYKNEYLGRVIPFQNGIKIKRYH